MGVNEDTYETSMEAVSCASCTTNGLAPAVRVLQERWGIKRGLATTAHAITAAQPTVDGTSKKDWRGGRTGPDNIFPSSTGAAKAVAKVISAVKGKITGMALCVPTIDVSVVDLTVEPEKEITYVDLCAEMKRRAEGDIKGHVGYTDVSLVSTDFETCLISCTFDSKAGIMVSRPLQVIHYLLSVNGNGAMSILASAKKPRFISAYFPTAVPSYHSGYRLDG